MNKKTLILLFGPMCSGKTSLIKLLQKNNHEIFHASMDNIKWFISDYSTKKYAKLGTVNRILFAMNKQAVSENLSLIIEGSVGLMKYTKRYEELAKKNNMVLIKINIEAPYKVLLDRFTKRVKDSKKYNNKISITDEENFLLRFNAYNKNKDTKLTTINSSTLTPEQTLRKVKKIIASSIYY